MSATQTPPAAQVLMQMMTGFWLSQSLHTVARLKVADALTDGPCGIDALATKVNAQPDALYRVMRALSSVGFFKESDNRAFELTPLTEIFRTDHPESMHPVILMLGEQNYTAWGQLPRAVQSGGTPFQLAYGLPAYEYFAQNAEANEIFNAAMAALVRHDQALVAEAYDFGRFKTLVDVGGGTGMLLATILKRYPGPSGILFDLPQVIKDAGPVLREAGVEARCKPVAGDFFKAVVDGGDAYLLSHIIHTFSDELCRTILRNVHAAMPANGTLLIVEDVLQPGNDPATAKTKFMDLNMLVMTPGGREHTREEFKQLLDATGFRLNDITPTPSGTCILEAVKQ